MEGEVAVQEGPADQQPGDLEELVRYQQRGKCQAHPLPAGGGEPPVEQGAEDRCGQEQEQPGQVEGAEEGKAHPLGDRLGGGEKVLHSAAPWIGNGESHAQYSTSCKKGKGLAEKMRRGAEGRGAVAFPAEMWYTAGREF